jgi:hypothetical protein
MSLFNFTVNMAGLSISLFCGLVYVTVRGGLAEWKGPYPWMVLAMALASGAWVVWVWRTRDRRRP